jgi:tetratricopeptide (TPR) repeat protein
MTRIGLWDLLPRDLNGDWPQRALRIREKALGPEHPLVASSLSNLGRLYYSQGQYANAKPLYKRALTILEKALGPEHPDVASNLHGLAQLYDKQGQYEKAEPLFRRALAVVEKSYGPNHPSVAISLNNLALLLRHTNRLAEAEPLSRRQLRILAEFGHRTGHVHPHFQSAINNYAGLLSAMSLSEDAIAVRVRSAIEGEPEESA